MHFTKTGKWYLPFFILFLFTVFPNNEASAQIEEELRKLQAEVDEKMIELEEIKLKWIKQRINKVGRPKLKSGQRTVWHAGFGLIYNEEHEQPQWVAHMILPDVLEVCKERTDVFLEDPDIKTGSATQSDYSPQSPKKYDRGHMAPAADLRWSDKAVAESFYYSNMSPQRSTLNQGLWADLEIDIRGYVRFFEDTPVFVITGPVLKKSLPKLLDKADGVSIPEQYFKVVMDFDRGRAIGFLIKQNATKRTKLQNVAMSVDDLEKITGLDFFYGVSNAKEKRMEAEFNPEVWFPYDKIKDAKPVAESKLPSGVFNSAQAKEHKNERIKVIGKVVSSSRNERFINLYLDKQGNHCPVVIKKESWDKFKIKPEKEYRSFSIIAEGTVEALPFGKIRLVVDDPKDIEVVED
jgi:endonuclease G